MSSYRKNGQKRQPQKLFQFDENLNRPQEQGFDQCKSQQQNRNGRGKRNNNRRNNDNSNGNNNNECNNELNDSRSMDDIVYLTEKERLPLLEKGRKFLNSNDYELILTNLSTSHRKFMHRFAARNGLKSRSTGSGSQRVLHLTRRRMNNDNLPDGVHLTISPQSELLLNVDIMNDQIERHNNVEAGLGAAAEIVNPQYGLMLNDDRETFGYSLVPPPSKFEGNEDLLSYEKRKLPMYKEREQFLKLLNDHSVIIVSGETGSGKSTQVPQYILEESHYNNKPCHIVVTQPRRIAAIAVATRVAEERGENCGETVGYQVRLKSSASKSTCLMYTTSGSFLRAIMCKGTDIFNSITHLIIDEIHERDKDTDFTLITIKKELKENKNLRIILMSATMDIDLLAAYFDGCPVITVPGQSYEIKTFHLEDVILSTGYETDLMSKYINAFESNNQNLAIASITIQSNGETVESKELRNAVDDTIISVFHSTYDMQCSDPLHQLEYYIRNEGVPINYVQSHTRVTPLMVACKLNNASFVESFLKYGANTDISDVRGLKAYDYAKLNIPDYCSELVEKVQDYTELRKQLRLNAYLMSFNIDRDVDHDLIISLIEGLLRNGKQDNGTIMVFLPGYGDIIQQRELIQKTFPHDSYTLFILHGNMSTEDQSKALVPARNRKIILSTNIAQTSITIPDLVYVIDSGKIKMKQYDSEAESTQLEAVWISKADACQRTGRSGRRQNGVCYRLYSKTKFDSMADYSTPEFLRIPLTEICLYAKTLRPNTSVEEYLSQALNQPSKMSIEKAIEKLKILNIFTDTECVTPLGKCIADLPIDVQLGKCLIYSIFLRCFQSVLTIVAYHSVKDPFVLPAERHLQGKASYQRKSFSAKSFSDHIGIINLYENYMQMKKHPKSVRDFCEKNFLSYCCMEQFVASRYHLSEVVSRYFRTNFDCNEYNNDYEMIRYALTAGLYPNVAYINRQTIQVRTGDERYIIIQRSSAINPPGMKTLKDYISNIPFDWIIFYEKCRLHCNTIAININTVISPLMVILQCGKTLNVNYVNVEKDDPDADENIDDPDVGVNASNADENNKDNADDADPDDGVGWCDGEEGEDDNVVDLCLEGAACKELCESAAALKLNANSFEVIGVVTLDSWIKFKCSQKHANQLITLRLLLEKEFNIFLLQKELNNDNKLAITILQKLLNLNAKSD